METYCTPDEDLPNWAKEKLPDDDDDDDDNEERTTVVEVCSSLLVSLQFLASLRHLKLGCCPRGPGQLSCFIVLLFIVLLGGRRGRRSSYHAHKS